MTELKITAANFDNEILHSDKPVLLDFYAKSVGYQPKSEIVAMVEGAR